MFSFRLSFNIGKETTLRHTPPTFTAFITGAAAQLPALSMQRRPATVKNYRTAIKSLRDFARTTKTAGEAMTGEQLAKYEHWLHQRGTSRNTTSCYVRSLRSLYNTIYPESPHQPFRHLYTGTPRTMKRALDIESVRQFIASKPPLTSPLRLWHDVFLFSLYALGMPFIDVAYLRWSDISDGFIHYHRHKTSQPVSVPVTPEMSEIMHYYRPRTRDDLVFPILRSYHSPYHIYQHRLSQYNLALKQLRRQANLQQNLTSYTARHTWATLANSAGIRLTSISQAMGHTSIKTTQIYLDHISNEEMKSDSLAVTKLIHNT